MLFHRGDRDDRLRPIFAQHLRALVFMSCAGADFKLLEALSSYRKKKKKPTPKNICHEIIDTMEKYPPSMKQLRLLLEFVWEKKLGDS
jgi:hypothetical protein